MKTLILFCLLPVSFPHAQRLNFFKEDLTFRLDSTSFSVEGYYWFTNQFEKDILSDIYYPLPAYAGNILDSTSVFNISAGRIIRFLKEGKSGISFPLKIAPGDTTLVQIKYKQKVTSDSAVYILTTTQLWNKPLEFVEYKLITPLNFTIKKFSYTPDKSYQIDKYKIYYWQKENFLPDQDMIIYF